MTLWFTMDGLYIRNAVVIIYSVRVCIAFCVAYHEICIVCNVCTYISKKM